MLNTIKAQYRARISDPRFSEILVGSAFSLAAQAISVGLSLISNVIIARVYGAAAAGILALVNSFLALVTIFTLLGTGVAVLRLVPEHLANYSASSAYQLYRTLARLVAGVSLATGLLLFFGSGLIAGGIYSKPHLSHYFAAAALVVVFSALADLNTGAVRGLRLIRTFAVMRFVPAACMLAILVAGTIHSRNPGTPVYAQLAALSLTAIVGLAIANGAFRSRIRPGDAIRPVKVGEILGYSLPMLMTGAMAIFASQTSLVLLGMFRSEREVGYFALALKLATLTSFVLQSINTLATPKFSELFHTGRIDELFYVAKKSTRLIFWTTMPILLSLLLFGRFILKVLFGPEFVVAYPAMALLLLGQAVNSCAGSTGPFMNMAGHQKKLSGIILLSALANIGLGLALIPRFGILGAAFAGMVSLVFWNTYALLYIKATYGRTIGYFPRWSAAPAE